MDTITQGVHQPAGEACVRLTQIKPSSEQTLPDYRVGHSRGTPRCKGAVTYTDSKEVQRTNFGWDRDRPDIVGSLPLTCDIAVTQKLNG